MTAQQLSLTLAVLCAGAQAQTVTLEDAVRGALERDRAHTVERLDAEKGLLAAERTERESRSRLAVTSAGARFYRSEFYARVDATGGLTLERSRQPGRKVTLSLRDTSWVVDDYDDERTMWSHDPTLSVNVRQSLVGGTLPGGVLSRAVQAKPAALRTAALADLDGARNNAVLRAARLFFEVAEQRRRIEVAETRLAERRVEAENLQRVSSLRLGGDREAQRQRLAIDEEELGLAAARNALARLEPELEALLGRGSPQLSLEMPRLALDRDDSRLRQRAMEASPVLRRADSGLKMRQAETALAALAEAPALNVGVSVDGDYYTTDTVERTVDDSFSALRPKLTVSVLLDLPLGRVRDRELASQEAASEQARAATERERLRERLLADLASLSAERLRLVPLIGVREQQTALAAEDLRVGAGLLAAQQAAPADVARLRAEWRERETALWRARVDLFLLDLEISALVGDDLGRLLLMTSRQGAGGGP